MPGLKDKITGVRRRRPFLDHLVRAFGRYQADGGDRLAASVTFFGFLSFFPLLALSFSVLGFVLHGNEGALDTVGREVESFFPGLIGEGGIDLQSIADSRQAAGLVGLAGLLFAGLGWIDALREAIRAVWHQNVKAGNFLKKKLVDIAILAGLGATLLLSLAVSTGAGAATSFALELVGIEESPVAGALVTVLGIALALLTDVLLVLYLFIRLPRVQTPWRRVLKGALFAAIGFEVLKFVGQFYIARTTANPVYGTVAIAVGLIVWINLVCRFLLFAAAWTVTAPFDSDVAPSGTSSPEQARKAGIPEEYADDDPDNPPTLVGDGAPSRLTAAVHGATPAQDMPEGPPQEMTDGLPTSRTDEEPPREGDTDAAMRQNGQVPVEVGAFGPAAVTAAGGPEREQIPGERATRAAATVGAGAIVAGMVGVGVYTARTLRDVIRG